MTHHICLYLCVPQYTHLLPHIWPRVSSQVPLHLPRVDDSFQRGLRVFFLGWTWTWPPHSCFLHTHTHTYAHIKTLIVSPRHKRVLVSGSRLESHHVNILSPTFSKTIVWHVLAHWKSLYFVTVVSYSRRGVRKIKESKASPFPSQNTRLDKCIKKFLPLLFHALSDAHWVCVSNARPFHFWKGHPSLLSIGGPFSIWMEYLLRSLKIAVLEGFFPTPKP